MTNYNERLDEILSGFADGEYSKHWVDERKTYTKLEAKQAITTLIKELVAEAKPERQNTDNMGDTFKVNWARGHNVAIDQFEQNLLKAMEEV